MMSEKHLKRERKKIFKFVTKKTKELLSGYNWYKGLHPDASNDELYLAALLQVSGIPEEEAEIILSLLLELEKRDKSFTLNLQQVAISMIEAGMSPEAKFIVLQNTKSPFVWSGTGEPKPKLEETFTSYDEIVKSIIPSNL